jgi:hypothetical protein
VSARVHFRQPAVCLVPAIRRGLPAVVLAVLAVLASGARPAAAAPNPFVGVVSEDAFAGTLAYRESMLQRIAKVGAGTVRQTLDWAAVEPTPGVRDWARYDDYVATASRYGVRVLPVVFNAPDWASSRPVVGAVRGTYPPADPAAFAAFAAEAVARYGPAGTFWAAHPELPRTPVGAWQIWNEPNLPVYWGGQPNAAQYVGLLQTAAAAIKAADPTAEVITAGLPQSRLGVPLTSYLRAMYAAGALGAFDAVAVNPYAADSAGVLGFLRRVRKVMNNYGDADANLWATEIGWSDGGPNGRFRLGAKGQGKAVRATIRLLWRTRQSLRLRGVIYFNWRDAHPYPGGRDFWGLHTGLLNLEGRPKPALNALRDAVLALR